MARYAYLITRTDTGRVMSTGTQLSDAPEPRAFAEQLLDQNRAEHGYYAGPRRCSIWPTQDGQPIPSTAPDHAEHFDG